MADYRNHTDIELLQLLQEGNERAMTEIFNRYWDRLLAVAMNRLNQQLEEAEECVQDVFVKLWRLREKPDLRYSLYTYLSAAIRYRAYDMLDQQYRKQLPQAGLAEGLDIASHEYAADAALLQKELLDKYEACIDQLPAKCRIVYRMSRQEGLSNTEIAGQLNIAEKTVEAHLSKANKDIEANFNKLPAIMLLVCAEGMKFWL